VQDFEPAAFQGQEKPMRYWLGLALAGVSLCLSAPFDASACDCGYSGAPCKAFAQTPYVFSGKVVKISATAIKLPSGDAYQDRLVLFEIERAYRGLEGKTAAEVVTGTGGGDCGYDFREGEKYLVYAYQHPATGKLYSGICTRTRRLSEASDDLEYFAKKDDPAHAAGIEGWITEQSRGGDNVTTESIGPLKGARVAISSKSGRWTVIAGNDGRFQLWGLQPGAYRVTPQFSPRFFEDSRTVTLKPRSCEEVGFLATPPPRQKPL
jgi:hypothetical protein